MDDVSVAIISKALDALTERYAFTAQNIANANTPGYRPVHVSFEESLRGAAAKGASAVRNLAIEPQYATSDAQSPEMRLDMELASASQTAMRYTALVSILAQRTALHRAAISEGGR